MILDEFGRPTRSGNTFITPEWLWTETAAMMKRSGDIWRERMKLSELRESVGVTPDLHGEPVRVQVPSRFAITNRRSHTEPSQ